jgi:phenylacetic acid degradation operon negative regulatory protein
MDYPMPPDAYTQTKTALLALGKQQVWSLMASLFGDLAQAEGSTIDGPVLSAIMKEMDVRPEAVRVALYRLRNDGWIISEKFGRTGRHGLTAASRTETLRASARIYASPSAQEDGWQLILTQDSEALEEMERQGFAALLPRVYLAGAHVAAPEDTLVLAGSDVPGWLRAQLAPLMLEAEYEALLPHVKQAHDRLRGGTLSPLQTAVLRCLLVHNWRRIILRHPALPRGLLPDSWAGHECHLLVDALLTRFPRPAIEDIVTN